MNPWDRDEIDNLIANGQADQRRRLARRETLGRVGVVLCVLVLVALVVALAVGGEYLRAWLWWRAR